MDMITYFCEDPINTRQTTASIIRKLRATYKHTIPPYIDDLLTLATEGDTPAHGRMRQFLFFWMIGAEDFVTSCVRRDIESRNNPSLLRRFDVFLPYVTVVRQNLATTWIPPVKMQSTIDRFCDALADTWTMNRVEYMLEVTREHDMAAVSVGKGAKSSSSASSGSKRGRKKTQTVVAATETITATNETK
jgi:hypothetical protein